jgi:general stress protein YciG
MSAYRRSEMTETADHKTNFATMDPAKHREIASKGGRAAHDKGTAYEWNSDQAREAARKRHDGRRVTPPRRDTSVGTTVPTES